MNQPLTPYGLKTQEPMLPVLKLFLADCQADIKNTAFIILD